MEKLKDWRIWSKWQIYSMLNKDDVLKTRLPETHKYSEETLWMMLGKYSTIIIKPVFGLQGWGLIQVSGLPEGNFEIHMDKDKWTFPNKELTLLHLKEHFHPRPYIVQKRINLVNIENRPIDLRIMVQRKPSSHWTVTGKLAKLAGNGFFITNIKRSGGKILPFETAIQTSSLQVANLETLSQQIDEMGLCIAQCLEKYFPNHNIWGIDAGIDEEGNLWIIEVNPDPNLTMFKKLSDQSIYQTIISFTKKNAPKPSKDPDK